MIGLYPIIPLLRGCYFNISLTRTLLSNSNTGSELEPWTGQVSYTQKKFGFSCGGQPFSRAGGQITLTVDNYPVSFYLLFHFKLNLKTPVSMSTDHVYYLGGRLFVITTHQQC